jgi:alkylation response protein AidB-like acyl-CoA dehydrogenase
VPAGETADGSDIGALAAEIFADSCPPEKVRALMGTKDGFDRAMWQRWASETGLPGAGIPEAYGGAAFPLAALAGVFTAAGQTLVCAPLLGTVGLAAPLLVAAAEAGTDSEAAKRWLPALCEGALTATVATPEASRVRAEPGPGGGWLLSGAVDRAVDGATADLLLIIAAVPDGGTGVFTVQADGAPGLTRTTLMSLDLTRRQAALTLDGVPAARLGAAAPDGWIEGALDTSRVLLAAELVGAAQYCLDTTVAYASQRVQFGRPIGSFQAVKQRAAEMLVKLELAKSAAWHAAEAADAGADDRAVSAALAKATCAETAVTLAEGAIQLHGGIDFTWEHDVHLRYKRAITDDQLLGSAATQWARITAHLDQEL